jgi:ubiquinol-cytochrome c reductase cytochrome c1 subunit
MVRIALHPRRAVLHGRAGLVAVVGGPSPLWRSPILEGKPATAENRVPQAPQASVACKRRLVRPFDKQQLQRGFKVYQEVCAACHSLQSWSSFRDLVKALGYNEDEVKAIAKGFTEVPGSTPTPASRQRARHCRPTYSPSPYANDTAARAANNNALPPDLSLMAKARHNGRGLCLFAADGLSARRPNLLKENRPGHGAALQPLFRQPQPRHGCRR